VDLLPPPAYGTGDANTELFPRRTDPTFDPIAAAMTSADISVSALLDPARAARLAQQQEVTLREMLDALNDLVLQQGPVSRATRTVYVTRLSELASNREADPQARAEANEALRRLADRLRDVSDSAENAHRRTTRADIERFLERPEVWKAPALPVIPPGPPI
jgi:hypothetical protein